MPPTIRANRKLLTHQPRPNDKGTWLLLPLKASYSGWLVFAFVTRKSKVRIRIEPEQPLPQPGPAPLPTTPPAIPPSPSSQLKPRQRKPTKWSTRLSILAGKYSESFPSIHLCPGSACKMNHLSNSVTQPRNAEVRSTVSFHLLHLSKSSC